MTDCCEFGISTKYIVDLSGTSGAGQLLSTVCLSFQPASRGFNAARTFSFDTFPATRTLETEGEKFLS